MREPLVILTSAAVVAGGAYAAVAQAASTRTVKVGNNWFVSSKYDDKLAKINVSPGDRVRFSFTEGAHNIYGNTKIFSADPRTIRTRGKTVTTKSLRRGTYRLYCDVHASSSSGQRITITVK